MEPSGRPAAVALTPSIGAELHGVRLGAGRDAASLDTLHAALREHHVVFARDQNLGPADLVALGVSFGRLQLSAPERAVEGFPSVAQLATHLGPAPDTFHFDDSYTAHPPAVTVISMTTTPAIGGDAMFVNLHAAYDALSEPMRELVAGLRVVNEVGSMASTRHSAEHPLVHVHPETGRRALCFDSYFSTRIAGLRPRESEALLGFLRRHVADAAHTCRIRWTPGMVAVWDNRCTAHYAIHDFTGERVALKVSVDGASARRT